MPLKKGQLSGFFRTLCKLTIKRLTETIYTKAFTILIVLTCLTCIILEAIIVNAHMKVYNDLSDLGLISDLPTTSINGDDSSSEGSIALGLRRLKNENVFFILLSLFQIVLGIDAIVRQNVMQLIAHSVIQIFAVVFAAIQVGGTVQKNNDVKTIQSPEDPNVSWNFDLALKNEIALVTLMTLFTFAFVFLGWQIFKQIGWDIYKKIGADIKLQSRFKIAQMFLLFLKVDAFFHFVLCIFYTVVMTQEKYYTLLGVISRKFAGYVVHILLTVLLIPGLLLARYGIIKENKSIMYFFLFTQAVMMTDFILIMVDSAGSWVFWNLAVVLAIILCASTIVITVLVSRNFNHGLKPYMQRVFDPETEKQIENRPVNNAPIDEESSSTLSRNDAWLIDE